MIKEIIIEPTPLYVGKNFKIKIKSVVTWQELANMNYNELPSLTYQDIERGA